MRALRRSLRGPRRGRHPGGDLPELRGGAHAAGLLRAWLSVQARQDAWRTRRQERRNAQLREGSEAALQGGACLEEPDSGRGRLTDPAERRERLVGVYREASECTKCALSSTRTNVVFGAGNSDADLVFVGEAPGAEEDRQGLPFVGAPAGS